MESYWVHAAPEARNGAAPPARPQHPSQSTHPSPHVATPPRRPSHPASFVASGHAAASNGQNGASSSKSRVLYPPHVIPNPTFAPGRSRVDNVLGELEQPEFLPAELDSRVDPSTVWMKVAPSTGEAVFFIPGACGACLRAAQHCDRSFPCARCRDRGTECNQAELRHLMPTAPVTRKPEMGARTVSGSTDKGKGKAKAPPPPSDSEEDDSDGPSLPEDGGRGKRVKKKRRLSASDEVDPNLLNFDGTGFRKPRARPAKSGLPGVNAEPLRPEDVPPTKSDVAHFDAVAKNNKRPELHDMRGFAPVWADRRRALAAAVEAFRAPQPAPGASVSIGPSGIARGVILEGKPPLEMRTYWGTGERIGTIITSIGVPRRRQLRPAAPNDSDSDNAGITSLPNNISDAYNDAMMGSADQSRHLDKAANGAGVDKPAMLSAPIQNPEAPVIEALLMAQRAQTPIAVAVANDFAEVPFKVPRAVVALGWFWIVEAWVEPVESPDTVGWVFRFEWCTGEQAQPWWASKDDPERTVETPVFDEETTNSTPAWPVKGRNVHGSTTLRGAELPRPPTVASDGTKAPDSIECDSCKRYSERVYRDLDICLNELCVNVGCPVTPPPAGLQVKNYPGLIRAAARILPEQLGLTFLPPGPKHQYADLTRWDAGRDFWRSWVCRNCRLANERHDWFGFLCQACSHVDIPTRRIYGAEALRTQTKCTGARPDSGNADWPFVGQTTETVFPDHIKIVQHKLDGFGAGTEITHALNSDGAESYKVVESLLRGLQLQGIDEVPLARHMLPATSARPDQLALSPFYTLQVGAATPDLAHFPSAPAIPWAKSPRVCLDIMEIINERAGRAYAGQAEFNALLVSALPPAPSVVVHPKFPLSASTTVALLVLGSSVAIRVKRNKMRAGELTAQHGDVVVLRSGSDALEIEAKSDGFAFLCLARRGIAAAPQATGGGWYVGCRPLDATRPLRVEAPLRRDAVPEQEAAEGEEDKTDMEIMLEQQPFRGQEVVPAAEEEEEVTIAKPPNSGPLPAKFKVSARAKQQPATKQKKAPAKPRGRASLNSTRAAKSAAATPPVSKTSSRSRRESKASRTRSASVIKPEDGTDAPDSSGVVDGAA